MGERRRRSRSGGQGQPRVVRLALEFLAFGQRHQRVLRRARPNLDDQVQEAADSILLNLGEAFGELSPGDKRRFFRYALRSVGEAEKGLKGIAHLNLLPAPATTHALRLLRDIRFDLKRLINHTP